MNIVPPAAAAAAAAAPAKDTSAAALHFSGKHCRRGTQGQKVHKEVIKQKKLNVHVFCAAAPAEVQGLPPSLLAADGNGCARSVSA